jgi:hypothetical protein
LVIGSEDAQVDDLVRMFGEPACARLLESCLERLTVTALNHASANRQTQRQSARAIQALQSIVQVAMATVHRRFQVGIEFLLAAVCLLHPYPI